MGHHIDQDLALRGSSCIAAKRGEGDRKEEAETRDLKVEGRKNESERDRDVGIAEQNHGGGR
jgi:hypothetical protein